ncbi:tRNA preQ1(34) S-adenosylmethionine ribosyltransferase-isomerase QueA [Aliikangiella marina]|uniref:S-adenosylmethionine:tRNA ribosyltransferase-isomerase n=1 Tax=Aliikangiella marina TaxID=1712262 RepID=A0A545THX8_9GAMM|nr:tRNA preQ1(34) S-adenosylmethionine ribosyltransferase-isomerase QueA [Aliikangiella marina]TQV76834.1 tRNA preQ1(34) S-adenosylmethionine ribosyltransferase-isomerase QueA [Aliikangiella marina]
MQKQDFRFDLPESLIANEPCSNRTDSRLMVLDPVENTCQHKHFRDLVDFLNPEDCLIFNNTKVIPARLQGTRESGGKVEVLVERVIPGDDYDTCVAQVRASNTPKKGAKINIAEELALEVIGREGAFFKLKSLSQGPLFELIEKYGAMPLPPYIKREAEEVDKQRYQTVYAEKQGAVAAPTAGLHFDEALMQKITNKGVATGFVTLHVGAGTFTPVRVDNITQHQMHSEWYELSESVVQLVNETRSKGGRVIAVGTTSVRCLESASRAGEIKASSGETDIFIYPGYEFKAVDGLITNFHLSESTLLMLVSAFAGKDFMLEQYRVAVENQYRFFSYGDSMFIQNRLP